MTLPFDPTRRREERDDLERLLEAALPAALSSDVHGHVDAERLAAWADHGLAPEEQLQIDVHLAACDSCQELAAELARTMSDDAAAGVGTRDSHSGDPALDAGTHRQMGRAVGGRAAAVVCDGVGLV